MVEKAVDHRFVGKNECILFIILMTFSSSFF